MGRWLFMLGGLILWLVHFLGVYVIASLADVVATADDPAWRMAGLAFSAVCVLGAVALLLHAVGRLGRPAGGSLLIAQLAATGALLALIAIVWQALPTVVGH